MNGEIKMFPFQANIPIKAAMLVKALWLWGQAAQVTHFGRPWRERDVVSLLRTGVRSSSFTR